MIDISVDVLYKNVSLESTGIVIICACTVMIGTSLIITIRCCVNSAYRVNDDDLTFYDRNFVVSACRCEPVYGWLGLLLCVENYSINCQNRFILYHIQSSY